MLTTVITGCNRGIGLELARQRKARGDKVIGLCRSSSPDLEELGIQVELGIDVSDDSVVQTLPEKLSGAAIDTLILNAGILGPTSLDNLDFNEIRRQFEVNALGPLRVVNALRPQLKEGAKIALITSRMGSLADNTSGGHYGYRMSKAALNMAGVSLAVDLRSEGIAVCILHPGWVRTAMTNQTGNIDAAESAQGLIERIEQLTPETSGHFWHTDGSALPW